MHLKLFYKVSGIYIKTNLYFWPRCYGKQPLLWPLLRTKKLIPLCTSVRYISHLSRGKLATSFQNGFDKCSRVLNLVFSRNLIFHEHHHILGYPVPLITRNVATNSHSMRRTLSICCPACVEVQWNADSN